MQRFAITHLAKSGLRTLAFTNQGRNHYDTREQADKALEVWREELQSKLQLVALEVRPVECYDHGDAKSIYFDTDYRQVTGNPFTATCCVCKKQFLAGVGKDEYGREYSAMYADTTGAPWKAYYCGPCSQAARELQTAAQAVPHA